MPWGEPRRPAENVGKCGLGLQQTALGSNASSRGASESKLEASDSFWKILENQSGNWSLQAVTGSPSKEARSVQSTILQAHPTSFPDAGHQELRSLLGMTRLVLFTLVGHRGMLWGERFRSKADGRCALLGCRHAMPARQLKSWPLGWTAESQNPKPSALNPKNEES